MSGPGGVRSPSGEGRMLTCERTIALLSDYLDGDLAPRRKRALDEHLDQCPACVEYIDSLRATQGLVRGLREEDLPPPVARALREFLRRERRGGRS